MSQSLSLKSILKSKVTMMVLAIVVFGYILLNTDWSKTWVAIKNANYTFILFGSLIMAGSHYLRGWRWTMLTDAAGFKVNPRRAFYSVMTGYLVNVATSRGGEVVRCAVTSKSDKAPTETLLGTVITERIIDLIAMIFMAFLCLIIQFNYLWDFAVEYVFTPISRNWFFIVSGVLGILVLLFSWRKFSNTTNNGSGLLQRINDGLSSVFRVKEKSKFIALSLCIWFGYWFSMYFQLQALDLTSHFNLGNALAILLFSSLGIIIPVPTGAGVWYSIAYGMTLVFGFPESDSQTFGFFTWSFSNLFHVTLGAIFYGLLLFEMPKNDEKIADSTESLG